MFRTVDNIRVFIMAAGDALRCNKKPKQLFRLPDGNTVIGRLIEQIKERGHDPVVVTHHESIAAECRNVFFPEKRGTLCDSISSTWPGWEETNIFILGDVVFTGNGIDTAMKVYGGIKVIGNEIEIYAMQFDRANQEMVTLALLTAAKYRFGKLRYFYKTCAGLPVEGPETEGEYMVWLRDETNDIDSMGDYHNMVARWSVSANQPRH